MDAAANEYHQAMLASVGESVITAVFCIISPASRGGRRVNYGV